MEITGKIIISLPPVSGTSKAGNPWKKKEYVLETQETYPKKVHFEFFGERADQYPLEAGQVVKVSFDIESREFNGRWFTSIRAWKAEPATEAAPTNTGAYQQQPYGTPAMPGAVPPPPAIPAQDATDDLPF